VAVIANFKVPFRYSLGETKEMHKRPQDSRFAGRGSNSEIRIRRRSACHSAAPLSPPWFLQQQFGKKHSSSDARFEVL